MRGLVPLLAVLGVALAGAGCGGASARDAPPTTASPDERTALERRLARSAIGACNGGCRTYRATSATCAEQPVEVAARRWYRCRIEYERRDGHGPEAGDVCAALDGRDAYATRPLEACDPGR